MSISMLHDGEEFVVVASTASSVHLGKGGTLMYGWIVVGLLDNGE